MNRRSRRALPKQPQRHAVRQGFLALCSLAFVAASGSVLADDTFDKPVYQERSGKLSDGTDYLLRLPDNWNGTVINDLDFGPKADEPFYMTMLQEGFAFAGTGRRSDRRAAWDAINDGTRVQESLVKFKQEFGWPKRVIAFGESAGGGVAMNAAENYAGNIDGAVAMCATTAALTGYQIFDVFYMFKTLLAPDSDLPLDQIPFDAKAVQAAWADVLNKAMETPEGRARIALAMTAAQYHVWTVPDTPRPDPRNVDQFLAAMKDTLKNLPARLGTMHLWERIPPHSLFGNDGVDYTAYFNNGDPQYRQVVRSLYTTAGLDLSADLQALDAAPRIITNKEGATAFFDEPLRHEQGRPRVPLLRVHTAGDIQAPQAQVQVYTDLVNRNGLHDLYRSLTVDRGGHCNFQPGEEIAAVHVMMERLDTGDWPEVSPPAMNALANFYEPGVEHDFVPTHLRSFNGEWRLFAFSKRFGVPLH